MMSDGLVLELRLAGSPFSIASHEWCGLSKVNCPKERVAALYTARDTKG